MKIRHFPDIDTLYIELCPAGIVATRNLNEDTLLDLNAAGRLCAITVEHASERIDVTVFSYEQIPGRRTCRSA